MTTRCGRAARRWAAACAVTAMGLAGGAFGGPISGQGTWETTLKARDIGGNPLAALNDANAVFYYDTTLGITWLRDWNYAWTSDLDDDWDGEMPWGPAVVPGTAMNWAANLMVGSFSGWRLPATAQPDSTCDSQSDPDDGFPLQGSGFGCTGSEMGHMYYVTLGNAADGPLSNTAEFVNMQSDLYWSGTWAATSPGDAWTFDTSVGYQNIEDSELYAVAVRHGDVAAAAVPEPVPEPGSLAMLLAGLGLLAATRRRRPH